MNINIEEILDVILDDPPKAGESRRDYNARMMAKLQSKRSSEEDGQQK